MTSSVIVAGARTPIGKFGGGFKDLSAVKLGAHAISSAIGRAGIAPDQIDYVIMGQVIQAGTGQITARQAAIEAGIPKEVPAITINKVCLSGLSAIALADQLIRAGEVEVVVAGGMESMSRAPYLIPGARWDEGRFAEEVVPVEIPQRTGDPVIVARDEGIRADTTKDSLAKLKPAFRAEGTITAGNASQISDGGAAVVVMKRERAEALGLPPLAEIVAHGMSAERYAWLHTVPAVAMQNALKKAGKDAHDLGLVEINEAFASVALNATRMLGVDEAIVNVNGGAVALGHPIGASGARLALTLAYEMRRRGVGLGVASLCGGGGQGDALIVRRVN